MSDVDVLAMLEAKIDAMPERARLDLERAIVSVNKRWVPNPGPQSDAYYSKADILLYGGAAGGGKTDLLLGTALTSHQRTVLFRAQYTDLGGLEERSIEIIGGRDGYNGADMIWRLDGRMIELGAIGKPGSEKTWQGRPHDLIGFDEGAQLSEDKVRFVMGWLRSATISQRCRVIIASNPPMGGDGDWLLEWFAPWLDPLFPRPAASGELRFAVIAPDGKTIWVDGPDYVTIGTDGSWRVSTPQEIADEEERDDVLKPLSRTFIPALLKDNPYLRGTGYRAQLQAMPEPLRSKLMKGDFLAGREDHKWQVIPTAWIEEAQARWTPDPPKDVWMSTLGVDVAQGGPDKTVLAPLYGVWFDRLKVHAGVDTKNGPAVAALVMTTMRNRCTVNIDMTGGWGISARDHLVQAAIRCNGIVFSAGSEERTGQGQFRFLNMRALLWWRFREALDPIQRTNVALPPGGALKAQLTAPRWILRGDRIQVESKDDLRARLGSSPDEADAVILAWHERESAAFWQKNSVYTMIDDSTRPYDPLEDY